MTIVETTRPITGGVDTHLDVHVAAAVDANGGVLGVESFATTPGGYGELCSWLQVFGTVSFPGRACHPLNRFEAEGMAMTIVESACPVTGGVDTHLDVHVAAAVDATGGVLGVESFATTPAGYVDLHG